VLSPTAGIAAKLTVGETRMVFAPWKPFSPSAVSSSIRYSEEAATALAPASSALAQLSAGLVSRAIPSIHRRMVSHTTMSAQTPPSAQGGPHRRRTRVRRSAGLQKSFWSVERKFLEPLMRFAHGDVRDHIG
jgi:hypothetical protein